MVFELVLFALLIAYELLKPKPKIQGQVPAGIGDFSFPTATEGRVVPLVWGKVKIAGPNVVWYGNLTQDAIQKHQKTGMFSSQTVTVGFKYNVGVQFALCRGPIGSLDRIWIGDVEVFAGTATASVDINQPTLFGGDDLGTGGVTSTVDIFRGFDNQAVSPYLARFQDAGAGTNRTPRYTGTCYLLARALGSTPATGNGAYLGNSTSIKPWAFEVERYPALFSGQAPGQNQIGSDANPMNVIYEILTNQEWGFQFNAADVDVGVSSSFLAASTTLILEGNGFSLVQDTAIQAADLLQLIQQQIDGVLFLDHRTGKWRIKLARADYDVNTVPQLTTSNVKEIKDFTRGAWADTTNQVTVKFSNRENLYKETYALAQDMANAMIQGGGSVQTGTNVSVQIAYPGVSEPGLANDIASRDLRARSYPLARATMVVDRTMWALRIADVVAWTDPAFGFTKLPLRITKIDYGQLQDNKIEISVVQDVYQFRSGAYGAPPSTGWTPPTVTLAAYPTTDQLAIEAPRAIVQRDPLYVGDPTACKVLAAARRQSGEASFQVGQRNAAGATSGPFSLAGEVLTFMRIGALQAALPTGSIVPLSSLVLTTSPDTQTDILAAFRAGATLSDLGADLANLAMVGTEFMLVQTATASGPDVSLGQVYRGVLDSCQQAHLVGDPVYLLCAGAGLTDGVFPNTNNIDVELRARSTAGVFGGSTNVISFTLAKRGVRPYPPAGPLFNGSGSVYGTPSLEGAGSGLNGFRVDVAPRRRDYRTADEVISITNDSTGTDTSTQYQVEVRADPLGTNTLVGAVSAWTSTIPFPVLRVDVITAAPAGTLLRWILRTRHTLGADVNIQSRYDLTYDNVPSTTLLGKFYLGGGVSTGSSTNAYVTTATGTHTVNIGGSYATGLVQVSKNGGAFATVITAGNTTGTFSATLGDSIVLKHTVAETPSPNYVEIKLPSTTLAAYGTFAN